jgi:uncharacterized PurR-regulated membrane protein YhhQ (DUF165 family)
MPFTFQLTPVLLVFWTVAVNFCVAPPINVAPVGFTLMLTTTGTVSVTFAEADLLVSVFDTAETVTMVWVETDDGAL